MPIQPYCVKRLKTSSPAPTSPPPNSLGANPCGAWPVMLEMSPMWIRCHGRATTRSAARASPMFFHCRQPPPASITSTGPTRKIGAVDLTMIASPSRAPASTVSRRFENRSEARKAQSAIATVAASGASSMKTWKRSSTIGVTRANAAARTPAKAP